MNVYFISGLGADERVFHKLVLPRACKVHHIKWPNHSEDDTIISYSLKIASLIDTSAEYSIIGLSFGGMIAAELAKTLQPKHTLIISSVTTKKEIPFILRLCGYLKLNTLVPPSTMNKVYPFTNWFTGLKDKTDRLLIRDVIHDTDPHFLKWAITKILNWQNTNRPGNIFHLHGSNDKLFPARLVKADKLIDGGGHFMILSHAEAISTIIKEQLGFSF